ncbi:hypothetical protein AA0473_1587 [Acetobacter orleanensis NRIC 0473]|nr:hypothetical protein AA0473_1587 [Acetobacter orleanensis NRIC 0473]
MGSRDINVASDSGGNGCAWQRRWSAERRDAESDYERGATRTIWNGLRDQYNITVFWNFARLRHAQWDIGYESEGMGQCVCMWSRVSAFFDIC